MRILKKKERWGRTLERGKKKQRFEHGVGREVYESLQKENKPGTKSVREKKAGGKGFTFMLGG